MSNQESSASFFQCLKTPVIRGIIERFRAFSTAQQMMAICTLVPGIASLIAIILYFVFGINVVFGFIASLLTGLATGIGALPILFVKKVPDQLFSAFLGLAAGLMLSATVFALILPGAEYGDALWPEKGVYIVVVGIILGILFLELADRRMPHLHAHPLANNEEMAAALRKIWMFVLVITVHNFPEGLAVGVGFGSGDTANGLALAIAIGIQNMPEGLAVAMPLLGLGYSAKKSLAIATLTGLVEPVGGLLGAVAVSVFEEILPVAMGFAAGAMLFVISEDIIPQMHKNRSSRVGTFCLMFGFILMMLLEKVLG